MRKRYLFLSLAVIIIITGVLVWACKDPTGPGLIERQQDKGDRVNGNNNPSQGPLFSSSYKIPALTVSTNNVIIAAAGVSSGNEKVKVQKSSDNGTTWTEVTNLNSGYSYPFFINCHNGDILLGVTTTAASKSSETIFYKSSDNGANWSKENNSTIKVTSDITNTATNGYATYGQGIALRHGGNKTSQKLMFPYFYNAPYTNKGKPETGFYVGIMHSKDGNGKFDSVCKKLGNNLGNIGSYGSHMSTKIIELVNGDILLNMRSANLYGHTYWMLSTNCGEDWELKVINNSEENKVGGKIKVGNNQFDAGVFAKHADFIRYEFNGNDIIKATGGDKYALMICSYERNKNGYSIMMTTNDFNNGAAEGGTNKKYAYTKELGGVMGGYPAITVLSNGTIATLTEESSGIVFKTHSFDNSRGFINN